MAIEAGNVFDEDNACICLLERGTELEEEIWHKLLILAINYDIIAYPRLAFKHSINIHNPKEETKISFHKAVCCNAVKIMKFFYDTFPFLDMVKMIDEKDSMGYSALEYARMTERSDILDMVEKMRSGVQVEIPSGKSEEEEIAIPIN